MSHWCSHYSTHSASLLHLPIMDFQCYDHLTIHVVCLPWVASLCKLFRNVWAHSVLLYSFHHYSLPRQSSRVWPPLASPAVWQQLITRSTTLRRQLKLNHYVGIYKKKVDGNAVFGSPSHGEWQVIWEPQQNETPWQLPHASFLKCVLKSFSHHSQSAHF